MLLQHERKAFVRIKEEWYQRIETKLQYICQGNAYLWVQEKFSWKVKPCITLTITQHGARVGRHSLEEERGGNRNHPPTSSELTRTVALDIRDEDAAVEDMSKSIQYTSINLSFSYLH